MILNDNVKLNLYKMIKDLQRLQFVLKKDITGLNFVFSFISLLLLSQNSQAQFVNNGNLKVSGNTILSIYMDYNNTTTGNFINDGQVHACLLYTSPSPRDLSTSRMPSSA